MINSKNPFVILKPDFVYQPPFVPLVHGSYQTPANFPYCCERHRLIIDYAKELTSKFPYCCRFHREEMTKNPFVNLSVYKTDEFAESIVIRIAYTEHHIGMMIEQRNWYEDITNYIDYVASSFGNPSFGDHIYKWVITSFIESIQNEIGLHKAQRLTDYINSLYQDPSIQYEDKAEETDLNQLYQIYQRWLSVFPFSIPPFDKLKERFENIFPVFSEEPRYNPYTGLAKVTLLSQLQLIAWLFEKTKAILQSTDSKSLVSNRMIDKVNERRLAVLNERHNTKQTLLLSNFSKKEKKYVQVIAEWLDNEKQYFKGAAKLLKESTADTVLLSTPTDSRKNIFNNKMSVSKAEAWFCQLAIVKNKAGDYFLSQEQVNLFIERAFVGEPFSNKLTLNVGNRDKGNVVGLFHLFYTYCSTHMPGTGKLDSEASAEKYIRLLTDHFDNWSFEEIKNNFRSGGDWKRPD